MFEITADDIALLTDVDLRSLVGQLCESEARKRGYSPSAVTWGGSQTTSDGGLDVRVFLPGAAPVDGFLPRSSTGYQVKKEDMPRSKILQEMCPKGALRPSIRELADQNGAYIIVSSEAFTSDTMLTNRRAAMLDAVKELPNATALKLDFYDRSRVATWLREHQGLVLWARERIGKSISGWQPYGPWAYSPKGVEDEYLFDDGLRIHTNSAEQRNGLSVIAGIELIRDRLRDQSTPIRLVGLSGVGKTRLAQALFDSRIGKNSLDPSLACYTNLTDEPNPSPTTVAANLIASGERAFLIIDNCRPELHRLLSERCRSPKSRVSLVTIEYDIREDLPESTDVISLEPSSSELIIQLLGRRYPSISPVDSRTIATLSGGNARIAIAIAATIKNKESISGISDDDLFKRLFEQRHSSNESLSTAAQALSLVYSFQGTDDSDGPEAELLRLGALVGKSPKEMFRAAAELESRELVQRRGEWRAVLPQALANRLATAALRTISARDIERFLVNDAPPRLMRSFSRRLGYLHSSDEARSIVKNWLRKGGLLANVANLDDLGAAMLRNVAPVAPEITLVALEQALTGAEGQDLSGLRRYVSLIHSLAYEASLFERCAELLAKIAELGESQPSKDEAHRVFASLFLLYYSGTHASVEQRLTLIRSLLDSRDAKMQNLGIEALKTTMEAWHFSSAYNFEFGARSRDYGYWPRSTSEVRHWFTSALGLAEIVACSDHAGSARARIAIAEKFRGLWTKAGMYDELERTCSTIRAKQFWKEGWAAVRQTLQYDSEGFSTEVKTRLEMLDKMLRPEDTLQQVRAIVLSDRVHGLSLGPPDKLGDDDLEVKIHRQEMLAEDLGTTVSRDSEILDSLLPELVTANTDLLWSFGRGMARGAAEPERIWTRMVEALSAAAQEKRNIQVFRGFLNELSETNRKLAEVFLDGAVINEPLAVYYPFLQTAVGLDERGVKRLMLSLSQGKAHAWLYRSLTYGRVTDSVSGVDLKELLLQISSKPEGFDVAVDILYMRLYSNTSKKKPDTEEIIGIGRELLRQLQFKQRGDSQEHRLGIIAKHCLVGNEGAALTQEICTNFRTALLAYETSVLYHNDLLEGLFYAQPIAALNGFFPAGATEINLGVRLLRDLKSIRANPLFLIPDEEVLKWCDQEPKNRYPIAAHIINLFEQSSEPGRQQWSRSALKLMSNAPDPVAILREFAEQFVPASWTGSRAAVIDSNAKLLDFFLDHSNPEVRQLANQEKSKLADTLRAEQEMETYIERARDERFE